MDKKNSIELKTTAPSITEQGNTASKEELELELTNAKQRLEQTKNKAS